MATRPAAAAVATALFGLGLALAASGALAQSGAQSQGRAQAQNSETAQTPPPASDQLPTPVAERVATLVVLDKFTGTTQTFEVNPGAVIRHGRLTIHVRSCEASPPWERPEAAAFLQVDEQTLQGTVKRVYSGWMFARAPALHPFDHPAYNVLFRSCKMSFPERGDETVVLTPSAPAAPAAPAASSGPEGGAE